QERRLLGSRRPQESRQGRADPLGRSPVRVDETLGEVELAAGGVRRGARAGAPVGLAGARGSRRSDGEACYGGHRWSCLSLQGVGVPEAASASLAPGLLACSGCGTSGHLNKLSDESADISLSVAAVAACGALGVDLAVARPVQDGPAIDPEH